MEHLNMYMNNQMNQNYYKNKINNFYKKNKNQKIEI